MNYQSANGIVTLTFDDGKVNAVGLSFLEDINSALDRAEAEQAGAVILIGRDGMFSAGFDLGEFKKGPAEGFAMVQRGFELLIRLYSFPLPLVAACTGHSIAMGAFITMACDYRFATRGNYKFSLPETAISMELPAILVELASSRISRQHLSRVALQSEAYNPEQAAEAGFVDETVDANQLIARSMEVAQRLAELPQKHYAANKLLIRAASLQIMQDSVNQMASAAAVPQG